MANKRLTKKLSKRKLERRQVDNPTPQTALKVLAQHLVDEYPTPRCSLYCLWVHGNDVKVEANSKPVLKCKVVRTNE